MEPALMEQLLKAQKAFVGEILTYAEIGLSKEQFRCFKKKVFDCYHEKLKPQTNCLLSEERTCEKSKR